MLFIYLNNIAIPPPVRGILLDKMQIIITPRFVFFVESRLQLLLYSAFFQLQVFWHGTKKLRLGKFWARKKYSFICVICTNKTILISICKIKER